MIQKQASGKRLKLARRARGLTLRGLEAEINKLVSAQAIGKYERGEMLPSSDVAMALARTLDVTVGYLLSPFEIALNNVEFRKATSTTKSDRAKVERTVLDHVERYLEIEEILRISNARWDAPKESPYPVDALDDAETAAKKVRKAWNLGGDPISNMTALLERHGIKILTLDLPKSVDGLTCDVERPGKESVPVVVCRSRMATELQRFTLAHELGHMLLDLRKGIIKEQACDRFARALLAPRKEVLDEVGQRRHAFGYTELVDVKKIFGVGAYTLITRFHDLKIIETKMMLNIMNGMGREWKTSEPRPVNRKEPTFRFQRLCYRALAEDGISIVKAAELLDTPVNLIRDNMSGPQSG